MNTTLETLLDILADERDYQDIRRPDMPSFIFFDDEKSMSEEDRAFRDLACAVEAIKAAEEHTAAIKAGREKPARIKKLRLVPAHTVTECHSKADTKRAGYIPEVTKRDRARASYLTRRVDPVHATFKEVEDDYEQPDPPQIVAYNERNDSAKYAEWYRNFRLTQVRERRISGKLRKKWPNPSEQAEQALQTLERYETDLAAAFTRTSKVTRLFANSTILDREQKREAISDSITEFKKFGQYLAKRAVIEIAEILETEIKIRKGPSAIETIYLSLASATKDEAVLFAGKISRIAETVGPIAGTTFVNPDGSKHTTAGTDFGRAKASYISRHKLDDQFVTVDRVQYENERTSRLVVGTRKRSDEALSNYFDPSVEIEESSKRDWRYQPSGSVTLHRIPKSRVFEGYCLTIRELEQCIIAGATLIDDDIELSAESIRSHNAPEDTRILRIELGDGKEARDRSAFDYVEEYIYQALRSFGMDRIAELVEMRDPALLHDQVTRNGEYIEEFSDLLRWVHDDDVRNQQLDDSYEPMLPHVIAVFTSLHKQKAQSNIKIEAVTKPKELGYDGEPHHLDQINAIANYMEKRNGQRWSHLSWKES